VTGPMVQITLAEIDALRDRITTLELDLQTVQLELAETKAKGAEVNRDIRVRIERTITAAMEIVRFAVQNLPPQFVVGWPHDALATFARCLEMLPTTTDHDKELCQELLTFAGEASELAKERRSRRGLPPGPPPTLEEQGPQTEEAKAVHEAYVNPHREP